MVEVAWRLGVVIVGKYPSPSCSIMSVHCGAGLQSQGLQFPLPCPAQSFKETLANSRGAPSLDRDGQKQMQRKWGLERPRRPEGGYANTASGFVQVMREGKAR